VSDTKSKIQRAYTLFPGQ